MRAGRRELCERRADMNATAYVRVSSLGQNLATQRHAIDQEAARRGDAITEWRSEKKSGKKLARPVLDELRKDIKAGRVSRVYTFRLDRITRSGVADTYEVVKELRQAGCTLVAVSDNLTLTPDGDDIAGEAMVFALALAAKIERTAINERIAAARKRCKAIGKPWGRPSRFTTADREKLRELQAQGLSHRAIAVAMKLPKATVTYALKQAAAAA
jgi:DNA invertase Pin-like site-specific DNA recombinase